MDVLDFHIKICLKIWHNVLFMTVTKASSLEKVFTQSVTYAHW